MSKPTNGVKAIIKKGDDKILLLKRKFLSDHKMQSWDFPGGLIDKNESEEEALTREVKEETGLDVKIKEKGKKWSFLRPLDNKIVNLTNYYWHKMCSTISTYTTIYFS